MRQECLVKFCGLKDNPTIAYAVDLGVDYVSFIVDFPKDPRSISREELLRKAKWLRSNHDGKYKIVAVTVDMPLENLEFIIDSELIDVIQLNGNEHISICRLVREGIETWKAISIKDPPNEAQIKTLKDSVDKIVLDSGTALEKARNTAGVVDNKELYDALIKQGAEVILSGNLDATNIGKYLRMFDPAIMDISHGIEATPGVKAKQKMMEFANAVDKFYKSEEEGIEVDETGEEEE